MKSVGYLLLVGGFLVGAYATALDAQATNWSYFVPAAVVAFAGLILLKRAERGYARSEIVLTANSRELQESLGNIISAVDAIFAGRDGLSTDDLRHEIDARLRDDLRRFAEARQSMVHLFGVQAYADVMSEFAAGERSINRVWSASTDGYRGEALRALETAVGRFAAAKQRFDAAAVQAA